MLDTTATGRMEAFLGRFGEALKTGDAKAAAAMFGDDGYWRDLVSFTWNFKTMEGPSQVRRDAGGCLPTVRRRIRGCLGRGGDRGRRHHRGWITFETQVASGYGHIRLKDGRIWTLLTTMVELKGHEEKAGFTRPLGAKHGVNPGAKTWKEEREEEIRTLGFEKQPTS